MAQKPSRADEARAAIGRHVRKCRKRKGWNQAELAFQLDIADTTLSMIERGHREIPRYKLREFADVLGCSVSDLIAEDETTGPDRQSRKVPPHPITAEVLEAIDDWEHIRAMAWTGKWGDSFWNRMSGHPVPDKKREHLRDTVPFMWQLADEATFDDLSISLPSALRAAVVAASTEEDSAARREAAKLGSQAYQIASWVGASLGNNELAEKAAERAILLAQQAADLREVLASAFRVGHARIGRRRWEAARAIADLGLAYYIGRTEQWVEDEQIESLRFLLLGPMTKMLRTIGWDEPAELRPPLVDEIRKLHGLRERYKDIRAEARDLSLIGSLSLLGALAAAREHDTAKVDQYMDRARAACRALGKDRNDYHLHFGPTNVAIHEVTVRIEMGRHKEALESAAHLSAADLNRLPPERRAAHLIDQARAHLALRFRATAERALAEAEEIAPEYVYYQWQSTQLIGELVDTARVKLSPTLERLAERAYLPRAANSHSL